MIKIIGFIIIVISTSMIGFDMSDKYRRRPKEIRTLITVLEKVKNELSFSNNIVTDAIKNSLDIRCDSVRNMLQGIVCEVEKNNVSLSDAFNLYIKNNDELSLEKNCIDELEKFFSVLGSNDTENEIKNIEITVLNLKEYLGLAVNDEKKYVKLFRTSGVLAGFLIAIILA